MSYSFSVIAENKDDAGKKVEQQLAAVVETQPVHQRDRQLAQDAAEAAVDTLVDPTEDERVYVSVSGSLSWRAEGEFTSANVSVSASIRRAE